MLERRAASLGFVSARIAPFGAILQAFSALGEGFQGGPAAIIHYITSLAPAVDSSAPESGAL